MKPQNILERHLRRRRRRRKRRREEEEGGRKEEGNVKAALKDAREVGAESTRSPRRPRRALQKPARARRRRARPRAWARGSAAGGPNRVGRKGRIAQGGGGGGGEGEEEGEEVGALGAQGHPGHTSTSPEVSRVLPRSGPEREAPARGFTRPGPPLFQGRGARGPRPRRLHCARQAPTQGGGGGRGGGGGWRSRRPVVNHRGAARRCGFGASLDPAVLQAGPRAQPRRVPVGWARPQLRTAAGEGAGGGAGRGEDSSYRRGVDLRNPK
ncbi:unnamed protein product [Prorocentrum cordatum]|uniref:Uncharacterized protein n=1 Tax=Prorocentrum cordatum TaxID=2364126 RepID=A0ABN9PFE6_9DINO|nr:unnamed protein product [Polarella glacialis]